MLIDTFDQIEIYTQQYSKAKATDLDKARTSFTEYGDLIAKVHECKDSYFEQKDTAERASIKLEEAMIAMDRK